MLVCVCVGGCFCGGAVCVCLYVLGVFVCVGSVCV